MIWGTTAAGTAVGTFLFTRAGIKKDRAIAIDKIKEKRAKAFEGELDSNKTQRENLQKEINRIKREREKQQEEIEALKKKIQQDK